ncbi:MarR family winged helix-turn-helix transcriptional regulator [Streptomyces sp. NPDC014892]|uniref:MarR family winged helix-turn-helix transcriptional regulator n=1 Tax=Streptomyces sp. NPDC014892 TaxID=3364930 RepID=UPI0036F65D90
MQNAPLSADIRAYETVALFGRLLETSVNRVLRQQFDITWEEYAFLSALHRSPHQFLHMTEMATALGFSRSRMSRAVARQELRGRVTRSACPRDARATHAAVTVRGTALLDRISDTYETAVRTGFTRLSISVEQVEQLVKQLEPLSDLRLRPESTNTCARRRFPAAPPSSR